MGSIRGLRPRERGSTPRGLPRSGVTGTCRPHKPGDEGSNPSCATSTRRLCVRSAWQFAHTTSHLAISAISRAKLTGGRRFDTFSDHHVPLVQWITRLATNQESGGSNPSGDAQRATSSTAEHLVHTQKAGGSNPSPPTVAESEAARSRPVKPVGEGSSPSGHPKRRWHSGDCPRL